MNCKCIKCKTCNGTGYVWFTHDGRYLGRGRCDDMDELEHCDDCEGTGNESECDDCIDAREIEEDEEYDICPHCGK